MYLVGMVLLRGGCREWDGTLLPVPPDFMLTEAVNGRQKTEDVVGKEEESSKAVFGAVSREVVSLLLEDDVENDGSGGGTSSGTSSGYSAVANAGDGSGGRGLKAMGGKVEEEEKVVEEEEEARGARRVDRAIEQLSTAARKGEWVGV